MPSAAEELKAQYASNRKQIARDYKKVEDLERGMRHCKSISDRNGLKDEIEVLLNGIQNMNKQNQQAMERIKQWWTD